MNEYIEKSPMKLGNQTMKEAKAIKLLGDLISINLEESVHQTVMKRAGVVKHAIFEVRTVIEDTRANSLGALDVAFNIWNSGILAMLLYNSETWINISKKTIRVLDSLFHSFCQSIFRVGAGTPIPSYYIESSSLRMSNIILERKLNFAHHLANLPPESIGSMIWREQINHSLPGLFPEVAEHLEKMGVYDLQVITKRLFKKLSAKYIKQKDQNELLESVKQYKKLDHEELSKSEIKKKNYFSNMNLDSGRMAFRVSSKMVQTIPANFSSQYRRRGLSIICSSCSGPSAPESYRRPGQSDAPPGSPPSPPILSQSHLLTTCSAVSDIREQCNPLDEA